MQAAVDSKHNLVVATHTINRNDRNALADIALEAKKNLEIETYTALVDKGYHNGRQIQQCTDANITTIVAQQEIVNSNEKAQHRNTWSQNLCTTKQKMCTAVHKVKY